MQAEDVGRVDNGDFVDCVDEALVVELFGNTVVELLCLREVELAVLVEQEVAHVLVQITHKHATIVVVCHTAAVHSLADQILQR